LARGTAGDPPSLARPPQNHYLIGHPVPHRLSDGRTAETSVSRNRIPLVQLERAGSTPSRSRGKTGPHPCLLDPASSPESKNQATARNAAAPAAPQPLPPDLREGAVAAGKTHTFLGKRHRRIANAGHTDSDRRATRDTATVALQYGHRSSGCHLGAIRLVEDGRTSLKVRAAGSDFAES
jgi:hypothetical protein